jgi:nucleoside-diphosphate-sugar epimerase
MSAQPRTADQRQLGVLVITGGAGFLGRRIAALAVPRWREVRSVDLQPFPADDPVAGQVLSVLADLTQPGVLDAALAGADLVIHAAAMVDVRLRYNPTMFKVNVDATREVIAACRRLGVRRLILTSTMDVAYDGVPRRAADEATPYPAKPANGYIASKIQAEQLVVAANGPGLTTCVLRPTGIYGPYDRHRLGALVPLVRSGKLSMRMGDGTSTFDHVYVDNVAHAHLLAADALLAEHPAVAGQCYFVGDHGYAAFFDFLAPFFAAIGAPLPTASLPRGVALALAAVAKLAFVLVGRFVPGLNPELTRYTVDALTQDFYFSWDKAKRDFGYTPLVAKEEAQARTIAWAQAERL